MRSSLWTVILMAAMAATCAIAADDKPSVPLKRVVLLNAGLAFFEHDGEVDGRQQIELPVAADGLNDVLKTLVVQDLSGGKVALIQYKSPEPIAATLRTLAIDLSSNPSLSQILHQLRGREVKLTVALSKDGGAQAVSGTIVGVERRRRAIGQNEFTDEDVLILKTVEGIRTVKIDVLELLKFSDADVDRDFQQALTLLATAQQKERQTVRIDFQGEGKRRVRFGYVQATPVWKTSYRLVLDQPGKPFLQGWAIVENTTAEDWNDIQLTLMGGRPVSFEMDLSTPLYATRPVVEPDMPVPVSPRIHAQNLLERADEFLAQGVGSRRRVITEMQGGAPAFGGGIGGAMGGGGFGGGGGFFGGGGPSAPMMGAGAAERPAPNSGVETAATAEDAGIAFRFTIQTPVTLARHQSALLPIINERVAGERFSLFNKAVHAEHPMAGLKLSNDTDIHLQAGPITLFDDGDYAGEARIADIPAHASRLVTYALNLDVEVDQETESPVKRIEKMSISRGGLILKQVESRAHRFLMKNAGDEAAAVLLELPIENGWPTQKPEPVETSRDHHRFAASVDAGKTKTVTVVQERPTEETVALKAIDLDRVTVLVKEAAATPKLIGALQTAITMRSDLNSLNSQFAQLEQRVRDLQNEQARLRENLKVVTKDDPARDRFLKKLTDVEDLLEKAIDAVMVKNHERGVAERKLEEHLANLVVE